MKSGNDAIDISGSILQLSNINITYAGYKAISAGEKSQVFGEDISILNSELGITSKDKSIYKSEMLSLKIQKWVCWHFKKSQNMESQQ